MKEKFYVFLDIHGVLYDMEDHNPEDVYSDEFKLKKESIDALNFLLKKLEEKFNVQIVITSTFRRKIFQIIKLLKQNNLEFDEISNNTSEHSSIKRRKIIDMPVEVGRITKTEEIKWYLDNMWEENNYLIIDDDDLSEDFDQNKIIKTDYFSSALNKNMVEKFLKNMPKTYKEGKTDKSKSCTYSRNFIKP